MTIEQKTAALHQLCTYGSIDPTISKTLACIDLMEILENDPDNYWEVFFATVGADSPFRAEAEQLLANIGMDATHGDARRVLEQQQPQA
jgi:hypothetical protein